MPMLSRLKPDSATQVGLLTAVGIYLIYNNALPSVADIRLAPPNDNTVDRTRKAAAWKSAGLIALVFLVARDLNSYIISGAALVGIDYMYKHNNAMNASTGKLEGSRAATLSGGPGEYPMPEYGG